MNYSSGCGGGSNRVDESELFIDHRMSATLQDSKPFSVALIDAMRQDGCARNSQELGQGQAKAESAPEDRKEETDGSGGASEPHSLKISYETHLPSIYERRLPGYIMTTANLPVGPEELLLLEGVVETVQTYIFIRFQSRIFVKIWIGIAFLLFPLMTSIGTAKWGFGTVNIFNARIENLFVNEADLEIEEAYANNKLFAGLVFMLFDALEMIIINCRTMLAASRNPVKKITLFQMIMDIRVIRLTCLCYFQWATMYMCTEVTTPFKAGVVGNHLKNLAKMPTYITGDASSVQYKASQLVPNESYTVERLIARSYEVCDGDGRHAYEDYPALFLNNAQIEWEADRNTFTPNYGMFWSDVTR
jgi:hypothetical protein